MTAPSKRCWFRFSLRTMFVVVTVLSCALGWLVWQVHIVSERRAVVDWFNSRHSLDGIHSIDGDIAAYYAVTSLCGGSYRKLKAKGFPTLPWYRMALGDKPVYVLEVPTDRKTKAESLFPEAIVFEEGTSGISFD